MIDFEQLSKDPLSADSYMVLFTLNETYIGFTGTKVDSKMPIRNLNRLTYAIRSDMELGKKLEAFEMPVRKNGIVQVKFAILNSSESEFWIRKFLHYASQSRVFLNPIVSDMRSFANRFTSV